MGHFREKTTITFPKHLGYDIINDGLVYDFSEWLFLFSLWSSIYVHLDICLL